jgi:hypothetical protein
VLINVVLVSNALNFFEFVLELWKMWIARDDGILGS